VELGPEVSRLRRVQLYGVLFRGIDRVGVTTYGGSAEVLQAVQFGGGFAEGYQRDLSVSYRDAKAKV